MYAGFLTLWAVHLSPVHVGDIISNAVRFWNVALALTPRYSAHWHGGVRLGDATWLRLRSLGLPLCTWHLCGYRPLSGCA